MVLITHTKLSVTEPNFLKKWGPKIGFLRVIEIMSIYLSIYEVSIIKHLRKLLEEFNDSNGNLLNERLL